MFVSPASDTGLAYFKAFITLSGSKLKEVWQSLSQIRKGLKFQATELKLHPEVDEEPWKDGF